MPKKNDSRIVVQCECGAKLKVSATAAGKKGRCPECQTILTIPVPHDEPSEDSGGPIGLAPGLDENSLLDELAAQAKSAPQAAPPAGGKTSQPCPACESAIPDGAALCASCGYNLLTGKTAKAASARKADISAATRRFALRAGTFAFGCALSFAGALVGAVLWSVVCIVTEYEIGYIAWGLGVLAGIGMAKGYPAANLRAGLAAALIAAVGIVAAKGTTFVYLSYPELQEMQRMAAAMSDEHVEDRSRLVQHNTDMRTRRLGLSYSNDRNESIYEEECVKILELDQEELVAQIEELSAWEAGGRWSNAEFVRGYLIYAHIDKAIELQREKTGTDDDAEPWEPGPSEWRRFHSSATDTVDGLDAAEQVEQAKEIQHDRKRIIQSLRLAFHQYHVENIGNPGARLDGSLKKLRTHFQSMSDEDRNAAVAELDAWNGGGKWNDVEYTRNAAINERVEEAILERNDASEDENAEWWEPSDEERSRMREEAARIVDAMSHDQRVEQLKQHEASQEAMSKNFQRRLSREYSEEMAGEVFSFFIHNYFGVMDLLFVALAVGSAFKIAASGGTDD